MARSARVSHARRACEAIKKIEDLRIPVYIILHVKNQKYVVLRFLYLHRTNMGCPLYAS